MALQTDLRTTEHLLPADPGPGLDSGAIAPEIGPPQTHLRCLCRFEDGAVFAYAERGREFVRASDRELWAVERGDTLVSARSGVTLADRRGHVYFARETGEPLYYERAH